MPRHPRLKGEVTRTSGVEAGRLHRGVERPLSIYQPVLAVTILEYFEAGRVVAGVRTSSANRTHQNVLSVPTLRVPESVAELWVPYLDSSKAPDKVGLHSAVSALFCRKLGLSNQLELQETTFELGQTSAWQGISVLDYEARENGIERLTMFNSIVTITKGAQHLPLATASYSPLAWLDQELFKKVAATKDLTLLGEEYDPVAMCVHGLCVRTTIEHLAEVQ